MAETETDVMIRKAIVAVGSLRTKKTASSGRTLPLLGGLTLPERIAYQLDRLRVSEVLFVGVERLDEIFSRKPVLSIKMTAVGKISLEEALERVAPDPVAIIRADRVYHSSMLELLVNRSVANQEIPAVVAALPVEKGKMKEEPTKPVPTGLVAASAGEAVKLLGGSGDKTETKEEPVERVAALIDAGARAGLLIEIGTKEPVFWHPAERMEQLRPARDALFRSLGKPIDGFIARNFNRPVSRAVSKRICRFSWTPNQISMVVFLIGLSSAAALLTQHWIGFICGGILFHLASVLDGVDGEIARVKYQHTRFGALLDSILDHIVLVAFIGAAAYVIHWRQGPIVYLYFFYITLVFAAVGSSLVNYDQMTKTKSGKPMDLSWEFEKPENRGKFLSKLINAIKIFVSRDFDAVVLGTCAAVGLLEGIPILGITVSTIYFVVIIGHRILLWVKKPDASSTAVGG